jgi:ATP-dependent DNA helicase RecQ
MTPRKSDTPDVAAAPKRPLSHPATLAMATSATSSPEVCDEVGARLSPDSPRVIGHGFDRPNISLRVDIFPDVDQKCEALLRRVEFADKPGIVYVSTNKHAESIANDLVQRGVEAVSYHGGLKAKDREAIQDRFMAGDIPVMVATSAFGLGVDKPDVRFVYHADVSDSLDAYCQEIGRAGREGEPAEAVLFFCSRDIGAQQLKVPGGTETAEPEAVAQALVDHAKPMQAADLAAATGISKRKLANLIHKLEENGLVKVLESGEIKLREGQTVEEIVRQAAGLQLALNEVRKRRLEQMRQYSEGRTCRRQILLRYFGDQQAEPCGNCDRCEATRAIAA